MTWEMCLGRDLSPTFFFFLSLLEILTKPWPWSGPACPKLLPGNHHPAPSSPSRSSLGYLPAGKPISHCHPTVVRLQVPAVPHRPVEKGRAMKLPTQLPTALPPVSPCELFELKYKEWAAETHHPPFSLGLLFKSMHRCQTWRLPRFYGPFAPSLGVLGFQDAHAHGRAYACWCVLGPWWHLPPCPWLQLLLLPQALFLPGGQSGGSPFQVQRKQLWPCQAAAQQNMLPRSTIGREEEP